ncbi:MAG: glycosyltransferase [Kiritimatiellae bacterium]|nr:glycosyltransferase [Kiritimatiellia bacterium]MDD5521569.1 glycosyltransferase [Kiritimatiellia bacterium]
MKDHPVLSVVIPVYNEEQNLEELITRVLKICKSTGKSFEVVFVDDGSRDKSSDIITKAVHDNPNHIVAVLLNRNYGQHVAIMAAMAESAGEFVITLDADLQNPPEEIPRVLEKLQEGADVVGTIRTPRHDPIFRKVFSYLTNKMVQKATGVMMHDYGCMLRGYRREIVSAMLRCHERSTFLPILANSFARHATEIEVKHAARTAGDSKYSVWKLINLQFDLLTSMTNGPLRLLSIVGGIISATGVGFGLFLFLMRIIHGPEWAVGGVFTLFAILFIFIGAQFVGLGLLGEYIGRIYLDVRARPRYLVRQVIGRTKEETKK